MKKTFLNGALVLTIAGLLCKLLGAIYRIPLSNILGAEGIGIYQMIYSVYSLALVISAGAIPSAMTISIAEVRKTNAGAVKTIFKKYFLISLCFGLFFTLIFSIFSYQIALFQGNILAQKGYLFISSAILFSSLLAPFRALFQGYENMVPTGISQILEQLIKLAVGLFFSIYLYRYGLVYAIVGAILGVVVSELVSLLFLLFYTLKNSPLKNIKTYEPYDVKPTFIPIFFFCLINPAVVAIDSVLTVNLLNLNFSSSFSTSLYGLQSGMVNSLINFPVVFSLAISSSLLPFIAKGEKSFVSEKIKNSFFFGYIIILPFVLAFTLLSRDIINFVFPTISENLKSITAMLLCLSSIQMFFLVFSQISSSILQATNHTKFLIKNFATLAGAKLLLTAALVALKNINIFGLVISNIFFFSIVSIINIIYLRKKFIFHNSLKNILLPLLFILILAIILIFVYSFMTNFFAKLFIAGVFGIILYILPLFLFKIIKFPQKIKN